MSLSSYSRHAYHVGEELRRLLHDEVYEPLLAQLSARSIQDLYVFRQGEAVLVERIATAAPAQRQKMLDKLPLETRFWAIGAAAQMAFDAAAILDAVEVELRPGGSYRSMIGSVQTVLRAPDLSDDCIWPFPTTPPDELLG